MDFHMIVGTVSSIVLLWLCRKHMFRGFKNFLLVVLSIVAIFFLMQNWDAVARLQMPISTPSSISIAVPSVVTPSISSSQPAARVVTPSPHRSQSKQVARSSPTTFHPTPTGKVTTSSPDSSTKLMTGIDYMIGTFFTLLLIVIVIFLFAVTRHKRAAFTSTVLEQRCPECGQERVLREYRYQKGRDRISSQICNECAGKLQASLVHA